MELNVSPKLSKNYMRYICRSTIVLFSQKYSSLSKRVQSSYLKNLKLRKPNVSDSFSVRISIFTASFFTHILLVVANCADPKMLRINAFSIVTFMQNAKPNRYRAIMDLIRNSVRSFVYSIKPECPVSIVVEPAGPFPTMWVHGSLFNPLVEIIHGVNLISFFNGVNK